MYPTFQTWDESLRIGVVSYLNSKPLFEDLAELLPEAEIRLDYPSRLADQLAAGELDVALIPSVEYFRGQHRDYEIVSDACVAARGPVLSVKLYSRVPAGKIRTLALDEGSRTSATLARVLLAERFGVEPQLEPLPMQCTTQDTLADAVLLIGDRAMFPPEEQFPVTWDLGQEWFEWTGLPFVFAMWVARPGLDLEPIEAALSEARNRGEARLVDIAHREAPTLNLPVSTAVQYLTLNLHYRLAAAERTGLRLFHQLAARNGLAPEGVDLVFSRVARAG
jgi:chorismate dehydratase